MKRALRIRHNAFEDAGSLSEVLSSRGYETMYLEAGMTPLDFDPTGPDLLVSLGGPISVNDGGDFPFIRDELAILSARMQADRPTLGICLGAQLMAKALGYQVYAGKAKEIGWSSLALSEEGMSSPLRFVGDAPVLHWHGETFDIPEGAIRLASTSVCQNQAFQRGKALGLQFHLEATASGLERWFIGHIGEIHATAGVTVPALRADTQKFASTLGDRATRVFHAWLDGVE